MTTKTFFKISIVYLASCFQLNAQSAEATLTEKSVPTFQVNVSHQLVKTMVKKAIPVSIPINRQVGSRTQIRATAFPEVNLRVRDIDIKRKRIQLDLSGCLRVKNGIVTRGISAVSFDGLFRFNTSVKSQRYSIGMSTTVTNLQFEIEQLCSRCIKFPRLETTGIVKNQISRPSLQEMFAGELCSTINSRLSDFAKESELEKLVENAHLTSSVCPAGIVVKTKCVEKKLEFQDNGIVFEVILNEDQCEKWIKWLLTKIEPADRTDNRELWEFLAKANTEVDVTFDKDRRELNLEFNSPADSEPKQNLTLEFEFDRDQQTEIWHCKPNFGGSTGLQPESNDLTKQPIITKINEVLKKNEEANDIFEGMSATFAEVEFLDDTFRLKLKLKF